MSILPIDVFASEILPRLPPTTLLRLKCLNKYFYDYISSKQFINLHYQHFVCTSANHRLIVFTALEGSRQCLYFIDVDLPDSKAQYLPLPHPFCDSQRFLKVVGSCRGLLCINSSHLLHVSKFYHVMILNPSTGTLLANISIPSQVLSTRKFSGFGYDSLNNDYKLVLVDYYKNLPYNTVQYRRVTIYSIKSNNWRCIENSTFGDTEIISVPTPRSVCVIIDNWFMHWLLRFPQGKRNIVCFDFKNEQWAADVPLPDDFDHDFGGDLGVLGGCLCVSSNNHHVDKFDVWIMKEYGVQASWTKFTIANSSPFGYNTIIPCDHAAIEEILFTKSTSVELETGKYVWYNIRDNTSMELQINGAPSKLKAQLLCVKSLVTGLEDSQSRKCEKYQERMKIDDKVKILQATMEH